MPDEMVIRHCAPTLASLKTGSLFVCAYEAMQDMHASIRSLNKRLGSKGLRVIPLRCQDGRCMVYVYRPDKLEKDLSNAAAEKILRDCGYEKMTGTDCVRRLMERLDCNGEFNHEIGLFLGYQPEDVEGFICRKEAKCVGCWKVYGDVDQARRKFAQYHKCTDAYLRLHANGRGIERLTVAV